MHSMHFRDEGSFKSIVKHSEESVHRENIRVKRLSKQPSIADAKRSIAPDNKHQNKLTGTVLYTV